MCIRDRGNNINFPRTHIQVCFICVFISQKLKEPPKRIKERGVAILEISLIDFVMKIGNLICNKRIDNPKADAIISGLVIIPLIIFFIFIDPPLNISRAITESILNIGTTTDIKIAITPACPSPKSEIATGSPNSTKLLLNMP